jgi:hypothetical protein
MDLNKNYVLIIKYVIAVLKQHLDKQQQQQHSEHRLMVLEVVVAKQ